jgi:hypothetical protein
MTDDLDTFAISEKAIESQIWRSWIEQALPALADDVQELVSHVSRLHSQVWELSGMTDVEHAQVSQELLALSGRLSSLANKFSPRLAAPAFDTDD